MLEIIINCILFTGNLTYYEYYPVPFVMWAVVLPINSRG